MTVFQVQYMEAEKSPKTIGFSFGAFMVYNSGEKENVVLRSGLLTF